MKVRYLIFLCIAVVLTACTKDNPSEEVVKTTEYKVAVILPLSSEQGQLWRDVADWALENIAEAQLAQTSRVKLKLEWYDELTENLPALARTLSSRKDIKCVIGPRTSAHMEQVIGIFSKTGTPVISISASSAELIRAQSGKGFFWSLVESDIAQITCLMSLLLSNNYTEIKLLVSDSAYGRTFIDWLPFVSEEMGIRLSDVCIYTDDAENAGLKDAAYRFLKKTDNSMNRIALCVPTDIEGAKLISTVACELGDEAELLAFPDVAYSPELSGYKAGNYYLEGIAHSADPTSGFNIAYKARFGFTPQAKEAQFFDALTLAFLAITAIDNSLCEDMNEALYFIIAKEGRKSLNISRTEGLCQEVAALRSASEPFDVRGASGEMDFDMKLLTTVTTSVYCHWIMKDDNLFQLEYITPNGSGGTESANASWQWNVEKFQHFSDIISPDYPELKDRWALLIAASNGWKNYRHQADVLNVYQILKSNGFDDGHIILIMEDDLAENENNAHKDSVLRYDGVNLYSNVKIDYKLGNIKAADIKEILLGHKDSERPEVVESGCNSNVLVFWSGHGVPGSFLLRDREESEGFTYELMKSTLSEMSRAGRFRKMLWLDEACYSESVAKAAEDLGVKGVMAITAANSNETSKAEINIDGIWMTNNFSRSLTEILAEEPWINFNDMYYKLMYRTLGSHVCIVNHQNFDNLRLSGIAEFIHQEE